ncbi:MAG: hypothetical protein HDQ90_07965 [Desulfovibrio sp.]|nr:hypothetical protein [Desulfovibrio sp.]
MSNPVVTPSRAPKSGRRHRPRRLLLFVHYNKWGELADYVVYLLKRIRKVYSRIVFISNSPLSEEAWTVLGCLCDEVVQRANTGFDFLAWKEALAREGREGWAQYDSVTLMNDTCFGPLFDLESVYRKMEAQQTDFWGLTNHALTHVGVNNQLASNGIVPEHIQSYFLCFHRAAFSSKAFHDFWANVRYETNVADVIRNYETQLTGCLQRAGLKSAVLCDTSKMDHLHSYDKARLEPEIILDHGVPFIKIKSFFAWQPPENTFLLSVIPEYTRYPISLIHEHLGRHFSPETSIQVISHSLSEKKTSRKSVAKQRIALHIHAFYLDILRKMLQRFSRSVHTPVDIFISTESEVKAKEIQKLFDQEFPKLQLRQLMVCQNRGRDVWPWLVLAPKLAEYDIAGHVHTKKAPTATARFGNVWREELLDCLFGRFGQISAAFIRDPKLGIVIPDMPSLYRYPPFPYVYDTDTDNKNLLPTVWDRLGCKKKFDFSGLRMLVFPYGNMFWYRPDALKPLWEAHWNLEDIPEEPLGSNTTVLHALERLPVYVSWEQGYDFRIATPTSTLPPGFQAEFTLCQCRPMRGISHSDEQQKTNILRMLHSKMRMRLITKMY